jgi:hypothetical protein
VKDVLESVERRETRVLSRVTERLPERLTRWLDDSVMRDTRPAQLIPLDEGEELLLGIDTSVGDGSGKLLEQVAYELATKNLVQPGAVVPNDLQATVARLRSVLERPFSGLTCEFELSRTELGFALALRLPGRPRAARVARSLALGTIRAAHRFCREAPEEALRLYAETLGDRVSIAARFRAPSLTMPAVTLPSAPPAVAAGSRRPPSRSLRAVQQPLTAEVERIMSSQNARRSNPPPPLKRPSTPRFEAVRLSEPSPRARTLPPDAERTALEPAVPPHEGEED